MSYRSENSYQYTSRTIDALNSFRPEYPDDTEAALMEKTQVDPYLNTSRLSTRRESSRSSIAESHGVPESSRTNDKYSARAPFNNNSSNSPLLTGRDSLLGTIRNIETSRVEATLRALQMEKIELAKRLRGVERDLLIASNNEMAIQKVNKQKKMRPVPSYMQPTTARGKEGQTASKTVVGDPLDMKRKALKKIGSGRGK